MLKKAQRLNLSKDFKRIATSGKRIQSAHFNLFYLISSDTHFPTVGIALAKKEFRKAHSRNRARRIVSEAIQRNYERLSKGLQLVIMPKAGVLESSVEELRDEFGSIAYLYKAH